MRRSSRLGFKKTPGRGFPGVFFFDGSVDITPPSHHHVQPARLGRTPMLDLRLVRRQLLQQRPSGELQART